MQPNSIATDGIGGNSITATPSRLLKQAEAAQALCVSEGTLRSWKDCPRIFIGKSSSGIARRVRYDLDEVKAWLKKARSC